ncbi:sugar ABC transporter permease [Lagierella sp.]|uniref:carbohydrate ABC transporter permease n=1 Tax=Lagierella sp. TaxID=2849657 RepID=UPI002624BF20|nr:sugar ABC transporter permease [Lagierella sp.]
MDRTEELKKFKQKDKSKRLYGAKDLNLPSFLIYILLPLLPLLIFWFIPMIVSLLLSFTDWDYISPKFNVVGISNYTDILQSGAFWQAFKNTILFGLGTVLPTLIIGFLMALLIEKIRRGKEIFQGLLFAPWITPMVAMSIVWSWMFRPEVGLINYCLSFLGIEGPNWLMDSKTALIAVMIVTVWKTAGWAMLYYADAISKIPKDLFEVGDLEGATFFQRIRYIYLPMTMKTTLFLGIISLINSIQAYDQISVLTGGGPAGSTRTLLYLFYQMAFEQFNMGKATTVAMIMVIITGILASGMFYVQKRLSR